MWCHQLLYSLNIHAFTGQQKPRIMHLLTLERLAFMGDPAPDLTNNPLAIEGMESLFAEDGPKSTDSQNGTVQDQTNDSSCSVQDSPSRLVHPITVEEAARLLNISSNAVCKRLRKGTLIGKKIVGKFKDEWLVEGAGLIEILNVEFDKAEDSPASNASASSTVQDQTKESPDPVQDGPDSMSRILDLVEKQSAKLEAAAGQIGYLQAQLEAQTKQLQIKDDQLKLLTDSQHKQGWWARFVSWFVTGR